MVFIQVVLYFQSKIEHEPITGKTEDEIRVSSAKSRASLRKEFKTRLEETRSVVEDRRAKSPAISVPSQKSLDEDQLIIDEEDDDLPIPDDMKGWSGFLKLMITKDKGSEYCFR